MPGMTLRFFMHLSYLTILCFPLSEAQSLLDVTSTAGISGAFGVGDSGAGASFVDIDMDGLDDLSLPTQAGDSIMVFLNQGGTFQQIPSPIDNTGEQKLILWADLDNDGDKDLFVPVHSGQNHVYENTGNLILVDRTATSGLVMETAVSFGASCSDYDLDGDLDIYVCNYSEFGAPDRLYRNEGNFSFTEVSASAGLTTAANLAFQAAFLDFNNDGLPDIYIAIDKLFTNLLYKNNGDGTFSDVSASSGTDIAIDAMNSGYGDVDNDGDLDIYVTNGPAGNVLLVNNGDETFSITSDTCGTGFYMNSWGGNFFDADNDGWLDLYVNSDEFGSVNQALFMNNGGCDYTMYNGQYSGNGDWSYGSAIGDYNSDGQLDIIINHALTTPYMLLENQSAGANTHWIKFFLTGSLSNRDAVGTWIEVHVDGSVLSHFTHCGYAYLAQNTNNIHFGLDTASTVDSAVVRWPSGFQTTLYNLAADQTVDVTEVVNYWEGSVDTDWNNAANWSMGIIPTLVENVVIPAGQANYPELAGGMLAVDHNSGSPAFLCKALVIQEGGQLTLMPGATIVNDGLFRVAGTLVLQSVPTDGLMNHENAAFRITGTGQVTVQN